MCGKTLSRGLIAYSWYAQLNRRGLETSGLVEEHKFSWARTFKARAYGEKPWSLRSWQTISSTGSNRYSHCAAKYIHHSTLFWVGGELKKNFYDSLLDFAKSNHRFLTSKIISYIGDHEHPLTIEACNWGNSLSTLQYISKTAHALFAGPYLKRLCSVDSPRTLALYKGQPRSKLRIWLFGFRVRWTWGWLFW